MDATSVMLGKRVRDDLREYRDRHELQNYNQAVEALLSQARETEDLEVAA